MIENTRGNLLNARENIIVHQVNCKGVMGAGIALQIRGKYPEVYEKYKKKCEKYKKKCEKSCSAKLLGECQIIETEDSKFVANLFSQESYGSGRNHTDYQALHQAMSKLRDYAEENNMSVAIPYGMGCGLAGGDWDIVYNMIQNIFEDTAVETRIYKLI